MEKTQWKDIGFEFSVRRSLNINYGCYDSSYKAIRRLLIRTLPRTLPFLSYIISIHLYLMNNDNFYTYHTQILSNGFMLNVISLF